jgi:steroid delta-isomerase-like uncharacterized protein
MTRNEIADFLARRADGWARHDATALAADHADDAVVDSPLAGGKVTGREAIERLYQTYFNAFPDLTTKEEEITIDGDRVAVLMRGAGTDTGGFMGLAPTGRAVEFAVALFYELRDGRIIRERRVYDFAGLLLQVGALKAKPA